MSKKSMYVSKTSYDDQGEPIYDSEEELPRSKVRAMMISANAKGAVPSIGGASSAVLSAVSAVEYTPEVKDYHNTTPTAAETKDAETKDAQTFVPSICVVPHICGNCGYIATAVCPNWDPNPGRSCCDEECEWCPYCNP